MPYQDDRAPREIEEFPCVDTPSALDRMRRRDPLAGLEGTEKVLVVDDEPAIAAVLRIGLGQLGYRVDGVSSATQALELFRADPEAYDALIVDVTMPHMSGPELARRVREDRPQMPVLFCTGFGPELPGEAAKGDADIVLSKPTRLSEVANSLRQVLDRAQRSEGSSGTPT